MKMKMKMTVSLANISSVKLVGFFLIIRLFVDFNVFLCSSFTHQIIIDINVKSNGSGRAALLLAAGIVPTTPAPVVVPAPALQLSPSLNAVSVRPSIPTTLPLTLPSEVSPLQPISATTTIVNTVSTSQSVTSTPTTSTIFAPVSGIKILTPDKPSKAPTVEEVNKKESSHSDNRERSSSTPATVEEKGSKTSLLLSLLSTPQKISPASDSPRVLTPISAVGAIDSNPVIPSQTTITPLKGSNMTSLFLSLFTASQPAAATMIASPCLTETKLQDEGKTDVVTSVVQPLGDVRENNAVPKIEPDSAATAITTAVTATTTTATTSAASTTVEGPAVSTVSKNILVPSSLLMKKK